MIRDKQIEEMTKICCNACEFGCGFNGECDLDNDYRKCGISKETAEVLYNAGYRKQSEVAREIFEEIEEYASIVLDEYGFHGFFKMPYDDFTELKKKYTEEGK